MRGQSLDPRGHALNFPQLEAFKRNRRQERFAERVAEPKEAGPPLIVSFIRRRGKGRTRGVPGVTGQSDTAKESELHLVLPALGTKGFRAHGRGKCLGEGEGKLGTGSNNSLFFFFKAGL